jgi:hypothetical protein
MVTCFPCFFLLYAIRPRMVVSIRRKERGYSTTDLRSDR